MFPRYGDSLARVAAYAEMDRAALAQERAVEARQSAWLAKDRRLRVLSGHGIALTTVMRLTRTSQAKQN